jgi:CHAT domain-containing protein
MIEMLRSTYRDEDSKLFLSGNDQGTYLNALDANVRLYHVNPSESTLDNAFRISEKGKSAVLLSHLRDKRARDVGRIPSEMLKKEASLKSDIYSINKFIHDEQQKSKPDGQKINSWNSKLFDLSRSQDELVKSFEKDYPAYYNLKYDNSVVSVNELQHQLTQDQAVITYSVSDSVLYLFAIDKNQAQLVTQVLDTNFSDALHLVREQLNGAEFNNYTSDDFKQFVVKSAYLYQVLLKPVENIIHGKELVLVPDADLGYLSFDILLTSMPDTSRMNYRKLPYLIRQSAISYAPSATAFVANLKIRNQSNNGKVLAFSPSYGKDNIVLTKTDNEGQKLSSVLSDLNNTSEEIKNISEYFTTKTYIDKEATERNFKQYAPEFKILHLAMHTLVNNSNPLYSKLVFYSNADNSTEDGMLNASELINMELNAELAVLSSCNTGSGKMQKGEGIMSLARDFFYAGVPGVVMTAWAVEDRSGVVLMKNFYKRIAEGKPRHEALRLAKLDYLEKSDMLTSHPHYWASYMNVGAISPISNPGPNGSKWLFILLPALVIISVIAIFYRKRRLKSR